MGVYGHDGLYKHDIIYFYFTHPEHKKKWRLKYTFISYEDAFRLAWTEGYRDRSILSPSTWGNRVEFQNMDNKPTAAYLNRERPNASYSATPTTAENMNKPENETFANEYFRLTGKWPDGIEDNYADRSPERFLQRQEIESNLVPVEKSPETPEIMNMTIDQINHQALEMEVWIKTLDESKSK